MTVCLGNICRSPMAEAVLRAKLAEAGLGERVAVESSGTAGWHEGSDADPRARATLADHGYPLQHRARRFRGEWFDSMDLILAMDRANSEDLAFLAEEVGVDAGQLRLLRSFDAQADAADVPDPYYGGNEGFVDVLRMVEAAADGVVEHVAEQLRNQP